MALNSICSHSVGIYLKCDHDLTNKLTRVCISVGMVNKLSLETRGNDVSFVGPVAESLFGDGSTNWGRVASLVAFGAVVSKHMKEKGNKECVEQVAQEISTYLLSEQRDWLIKNNAWVSFRKWCGGNGCITVAIAQPGLRDQWTFTSESHHLYFD